MKRQRNLFPRACRCLARLLLFAGLISVIGTCALIISECLSPSPDLPSSTPPSLTPPNNSENSTLNASSLIWLIIILFLFIIGLIVSIRQFNTSIRKAIAQIAKLFTLPIFATELTLSLLIWGACIVLMLIIYPIFAILPTCALVLNLLLFFLAWIFYHRPQYQL